MIEAASFALACFAAIFPIVNPFSAAGMLVALTPDQEAARRNEQSRRAVVFMTAIMLVAYMAGSYILNFFSISQPALILSAGLLVCRSGWRSITGAERLSSEQRAEGEQKVDVSLTPLGMPMLAGPGTISVVIGLSAEAHTFAHHLAAVVAMLAVAVVSYGVLKAAPSVVRFLGKTGEAALTKVLGLLILSVGIQFMINGLRMVAGDLGSRLP